MHANPISTLPSSALVSWLEKFIQSRLSPNLALSFDFQFHNWIIRCPTSDFEITLRHIPDLYKLGDNSSLPCTSWNIWSHGFQFIERFFPAPGSNEASQPLLSETRAGFHLNYDILGLAYWMLARLEEVDPPSDLLDNHNRFPASASHAFRFCYLDRPIVDEWLLILRQVVERLWPRLLLVQTTFNLVLSHDVDIPSAYGFSTKSSLVRSVISDLLKRRHLIQTVSAPLIHLNTKQKLHPRDPYNTFDWLMDISDFLGISSSFYFICGRTNPYFDSQYDLIILPSAT